MEMYKGWVPGDQGYGADLMCTLCKAYLAAGIEDAIAIMTPMIVMRMMMTMRKLMMMR